MSESQTAAELIDALREGAQAVAEGGFTLDRDAAAAKLAAYRYADRSSYFVPLVEALHRLGASSVEVRQKGADLFVTAKPVELPEPAQTLHQLRGQLLGASTPLELERLTLALDMALGREAVERIGLSYADEERGFVATYTRDTSPQVASREPGQPGQLQLIIDRPWTSALSLQDPCKPELEHLRAAVALSERSVYLDGTEISRQSHGWLASRRKAGRDFVVLVGRPDHDLPARVELWSAGVRVESRELEGFSIEAQLHLVEPRYDLSGAKVIDDEAVHAGLDQIRRVRAHLDYRHPRSASAHLDPRVGYRRIVLTSLLLATLWCGLADVYVQTHDEIGTFVLGLTLIFGGPVYGIGVLPNLPLVSHQDNKRLAVGLGALALPLGIALVYALVFAPLL